MGRGLTDLNELLMTQLIAGSGVCDTRPRQVTKLNTIKGRKKIVFEMGKASQ